MVRGFFDPELLVERDGWAIDNIGLDENDVNVQINRDPFQLRDEAGRYTATPMGFEHSKVVDVDLAAILLKLVEHIGRETGNVSMADCLRYDGDEMRLGQKARVRAIRRSQKPISMVSVIG